MKADKTKKLVLCAFFSVISLTLYAVEALIPPIVPIPGFKIGLAYLPVMLVMFIGGKWKAIDGISVLLVRVLLSALIFTNPLALALALSGGALSMLVMLIFSRVIKEPWGIIPCGIFSAIAHNIGQVTTAAILSGTMFFFGYLPYLIAAAFLTGTFSGIVTYFLTAKPGKIMTKIKYLQ